MTKRLIFTLFFFKFKSIIYFFIFIKANEKGTCICDDQRFILILFLCNGFWFISATIDNNYPRLYLKEKSLVLLDMAGHTLKGTQTRNTKKVKHKSKNKSK